MLICPHPFPQLFFFSLMKFAKSVTMSPFSCLFSNVVLQGVKRGKNSSLSSRETQKEREKIFNS